jgi:histidyl-tRNA synthetase
MIQKPKGTLDLYGLDAKTYEYVINYMSSFLNIYNYNYVKIPTFEASELYRRGVGESSDIVNKEMYDFTDKSDRNMTLRPEFTAGVVRMFLENKLYSKEVNKFYYCGSAFRYERPQSGRYREFTQFGVEAFGIKNPYFDAEIISIAYKMLTDLGLKDLTVKINSLGDNASRDNYRDALRKYFEPKLNDLCEDCKNRFNTNVLRILDCKVDAESDILKNAPKTIDYLTDESKEYFNNLKTALNVLEVPFEEDSSLVRGLDYYTDTVFEIVYKNSELGNASVVCGGGRYDNLVNELGKINTPAIGFSIGVERLVLLLNEIGVNPINNKIDIYVMNLGQDKYAYEVVDMLRNSGFITETDYLNKSMKAQFKLVDDLNPDYVLIIGEDEAKGNYITVKDNLTKENKKVEFDELIEYLSMI